MDGIHVGGDVSSETSKYCRSPFWPCKLPFCYVTSYCNLEFVDDLN